jgi:hypothetical protein
MMWLLLYRVHQAVEGATVVLADQVDMAMVVVLAVPVDQVHRPVVADTHNIETAPFVSMHATALSSADGLEALQCKPLRKHSSPCLRTPTRSTQWSA